MQPNEPGPIQTIRISEKEKEKLIWAIDQAPQITVGEDPGRLHIKPANTNAVLALLEKGAQPLEFEVIAYSHGRYGISLIHGRYIHPDTRCRVRFQSLSGEWHERVGRTGQCIHVKGTIHALLVLFDEPINLDEFAMLTPDEEHRHLEEISQELPHTDNEEFSGLISQVLFIDDQPSDRKLISHWLNKAGMKVCTAGTSESAYKQIEDNNFDLLIIDLRLGTEDGTELIRALRSNRCVQPILAVSADDTQEMRTQAIASGANAFLPKPFTSQTLVSTTKQLMGIDPDDDGAPLYSELADDEQMLPLLMGYVRSLAGTIEILREANANNDYDTIEMQATSLKGCGIGYGYPTVTSSAAGVLAVLNSSVPDMDEIKRQTNALTMTLSRVQARKPNNA